jgi:hypothetical protein
MFSGELSKRMKSDREAKQPKKAVGDGGVLMFQASTFIVPDSLVESKVKDRIDRVSVSEGGMRWLETKQDL